MPRRIPDYPDAFYGWNYISSFGSTISIVSSFLFLYIIFDCLTQNNTEKSSNYWFVPDYFTSERYNLSDFSATSLEWNVTSPPAFHCFNVLPIHSSNNNII